MNARHAVATVLVGIVATFAVGCIAPAQGDETTGSTEEAMLPVNQTPTLYCPAGGSLSATDRFESSLAALGCTNKLVVFGNGTDNPSWNQVLCWKSTKAVINLPCSLTQMKLDACPTTTGNIDTLANAWTNSYPVNSVEAAGTECSGGGAAPTGKTYVDYDPTCGSGTCTSRIVGG